MSSFHTCTKNHNHMMCDSWDTESARQNFLSFWAIFCPFTTWPAIMILKIKILKKKWNKCLEILCFYTYMCNISEDHIIYGSWNIRRDRQKILSFWTILFTFTPLNTKKIKSFEKMKKTLGDIIILHKCTKSHDHMLHCSWDTIRDGCNSYFSFWAIFCPFTPLTIQKIKMSKKWKNAWKYHHFTHVYQK